MAAPHEQFDAQYRDSNEIAYSQHHEEYQPDGMYDGQYVQPPPETEAYSGIPAEMILSHICASAHCPRDSTEQAKEEADFSWEPVRDWIRNHTEEELREAAQQRGHHAMTALHVACRNAPPLDVIDCLLIAAGETAEWQDSMGCLPLHYACGFSATFPVIKTLVDIFPESKTIVDVQGKTPLHYAMRASNSDPSWAAVVLLLSSSGAPRITDQEGMLPLHHACAYGTSEEALRVLTSAYDQGIMTRDYQGRTPLTFALSNAGRKASPVVVRLLLNSNKDMVNATGGGPSPVKTLAQFAQNRAFETAERESVLKCLEHLLSFNPDPTADFFTALQSLPEWLKERAVVMKNVQTLLNMKIAQRFPTGILLSDFFVQIMVLIFYAWSISKAVKQRCDPADSRFREPVDMSWLVPLYLGGGYFFVRALTQILSLLALGAFRVWFENPSTWLDVTYIFLVWFWAIAMTLEPSPRLPDIGGCDEADEQFRTGAAISVVFMWMKFLAYLGNTYIDFAVFLGGLFYVVRRLVAFMLCLCITLIAFSQMFYTIYSRDPEVCLVTGKIDIQDFQCGDFSDVKPYCGRWTAFLNTFTMLLGEVDEKEFNDDGIPLALFVLFMIFVVILLASVLIAIVTDSYKVIQDQRAAIVFWSNRLVFVAESDSVATGPWKKHIKELFGLKVTKSDAENAEVTFGRELWDQLMDLYHDEVDYGTFSFGFMSSTLARLFVGIIVIPFWALIGLLTFGSLWPPQIREYIFTSKVLKHSSKADEDDALRKMQTRILHEEVLSLKEDLLEDLAMDRTQIVQMKSEVAERKQQIQVEMKKIQQLVTLLFEHQSGM